MSRLDRVPACPELIQDRVLEITGGGGMNRLFPLGVLQLPPLPVAEQQVGAVGVQDTEQPSPVMPGQGADNLRTRDPILNPPPG